MDADTQHFHHIGDNSISKIKSFKIDRFSKKIVCSQVIGPAESESGVAVTLALLVKALIHSQKRAVKLSAKCTPAYILFTSSNCYQFALVLNLYANSANKVLRFAGYDFHT